MPAAQLWLRIYRVTGFFAGAADDLTYHEYDANGSLVAVTDPAAYTTYFWYDQLHRQDKVIDAKGNVIHETSGRNMSEFNKY